MQVVVALFVIVVEASALLESFEYVLDDAPAQFSQVLLGFFFCFCRFLNHWNWLRERRGEGVLESQRRFTPTDKIRILWHLPRFTGLTFFSFSTSRRSGRTMPHPYGYA